MELIKTGDYNFVFMDISMPRKDEIDTTKEIRCVMPTSDELHIVALTANAVSGDRDKFLAAGMNDYISKPATVDDILRALKTKSMQ